MEQKRKRKSDSITEFKTETKMDREIEKESKMKIDEKGEDNKIRVDDIDFIPISSFILEADLDAGNLISFMLSEGTFIKLGAKSSERTIPESNELSEKSMSELSELNEKTMSQSSGKVLFQSSGKVLSRSSRSNEKFFFISNMGNFMVSAGLNGEGEDDDDDVRKMREIYEPRLNIELRSSPMDSLSLLPCNEVIKRKLNLYTPFILQLEKDYDVNELNNELIYNLLLDGHATIFSSRRNMREFLCSRAVAVDRSVLVNYVVGESARNRNRKRLEQESAEEVLNAIVKKMKRDKSECYDCMW